MNPLNDSFKYQQYSQISIGNEVYREKDAVIIDSPSGKKIAVINHIYDSNDESLLNVTKYIFAKDLKNQFKKQRLEYDKKKEVVLDQAKCYDISLKQVIDKCKLVIPCPNNDNYYIQPDTLDSYNFCRYSLKKDQLVPLLDQQTDLHTPQGSTNKNKMNTITETNSNIEIVYVNDYCSPTQRNQVKRNLNKSFGNSPTSKEKSILNYSKFFSSDDDVENSSPSTVRKSGRNVPKKSYADYISPQKTPTKRRLKSNSLDDEYRPNVTKNKVPKNTPKKLVDSRSSSRVTTPKRQSRAPIRYIEEINQRALYGTPARRSLKLTYNDENNSPKTTRSNRNSVQSSEEHTCNENLDNSLRKKLLKVALEKLELDDSKNENLEKKEEVRLNALKIRINLERLNLSTDDSDHRDDSDNLGFSSISSSEYESTPKKRKPVKTKTPKSNKKSSRSVEVSRKSVQKSPIQTPKTPRNRARLIREGIVTPSMQERSKKIQGTSTPLMQARTQLHVSFVPDSLPCREKEYCDIYNFVEGKLSDGCGGCMYISGVPGTGKTATVTSVINHLQSNKRIPKFNFVNINGMRLTEPRQLYVEILKQIKGKTVSWEQAQHTLEEMFVKVGKMDPIVMLIDELDILCTKRQDVVYNLLDWPTKAKNQLIVITIANTMDLPERLLMSRVTSRLGLTRLTFQAYTFKQLQEIVTKRLCGTNSFNPDAVQFVARKVASVSGDARRALDICRRSAEIAEAEGKTQSVGMNHVNEALNAMITQPKILAIKSCSMLEQLILQSIVTEVERTGVEETTFRDVYKMLVTCAAIQGFKMVSSTLAQNAITRLGACRLILAEQKCNNMFQKIILNVSNDDIYYALQKTFS